MSDYKEESTKATSEDIDFNEWANKCFRLISRIMPDGDGAVLRHAIGQLVRATKQEVKRVEAQRNASNRRIEELERYEVMRGPTVPSTESPYADPAFIDGTPGNRQAARTKAKYEMGYDREPPRCETCRWFNSAKDGHPTSPIRWQLAHCRYGHFSVTPLSVCDKWQSFDGTILE